MALGFPILKHFWVFKKIYINFLYYPEPCEPKLICTNMLFYFNSPIAPRMAKIVYNFGLSGCNRVKPQISDTADIGVLQYC